MDPQSTAGLSSHGRLPHRTRSLLHSGAVVLPRSPKPINTFVMPSVPKGMKLRSSTMRKASSLPQPTMTNLTAHTPLQLSGYSGFPYGEVSTASGTSNPFQGEEEKHVTLDVPIMFEDGAGFGLSKSETVIESGVSVLDIESLKQKGTDRVGQRIRMLSENETILDGKSLDDNMYTVPKMQPDWELFTPRECEVDRRQYIHGFRMRSSRYEFRESTVDSDLTPVSDGKNIIIRARGNDNRFMVREEDRAVMSTLSHNQVCKAVFQKREFFHSELGMVSAFFHMSSQSYLSVSPKTRAVTFMEESSFDETSTGVVSVHGPYNFDNCVFEDDASSDPDTTCLFVVVTKGQSSLQPALCDGSSLDIDGTDGTVMTVHGQHWDFKILSADQASKFISKRDLKKLMKRSCIIVLAVCRM